MTLGSLYIDAQGYVPALLGSLPGMSCPGTYWLLGGTWFQCRNGGFWMISYQCFLEAGVLWCSQVWGLSLLPLVFSLILTIASRLLHPYSTDDKTSRLMVKRFSTVWDTQRGSQSYMKKRRGRRELEMSRRRERGAQEERDRSTQLSDPTVFSVAQTPTKIHRIGLGREGERRK